MDWLKVFYFFLNMGPDGLHAGTYLINVKQYPCLLLGFIVMLLCAVSFSYYFYFVHTLKRVQFTARKSQFIKVWLLGMLVSFLLSEIVIAITNKIPNSNILKPFWGNYGDVFWFSLINAVIYYTVFFAVVAFFMKRKSKNAKGIYFF